MRGKGVVDVLVSEPLGITPAYAGKRGSGSLPRSCRRDHPRVCGKKVTVIRSQTINEGSPPRVRGKGTLRELKRFSSGITPACAGKSRRFFVFVWFKEDHPRVCGEKRLLLHIPERSWGSPPRVRGKVEQRIKDYQAAWITPACAGKRSKSWHSHSPQKDHPRVCGEKCQSTPASPQIIGSPPRVRGKGSKSPVTVRLMGITPACAGKSRDAAASTRGS